MCMYVYICMGEDSSRYWFVSMYVCMYIVNAFIYLYARFHAYLSIYECMDRYVCIHACM